MLPRSLYELLPYLYLVIGAASGLMIESSLILIASLLLISAGLLTLFMRWNYREEKKLRQQQTATATETAVRQARRAMDAPDKRSGRDRRKREASHFPLTDYAGRLVQYERRRRERRNYNQQSMA